MRNVALLQAVMKQITDHPELHDQTWWFSDTDCGTAACFAGWACVLSGWRKAEGLYATVVNDQGEDPYSAGDKAQELLGIDWRERETLFDAANSHKMLNLMVDDLVSGRKMKPWNIYKEMSHDVPV